MNRKRLFLGFSFIVVILSFYRLTASSVDKHKINGLKCANYTENRSIVSNNYGETNRDSSIINSKSIRSIPPLNPIRIIGECAIGAVIESVSLNVLIFLGPNNRIWEWGIGGFPVLPDVGLILADQLGVYIIGCIGDETGSLPKTFVYGTTISIGLQAISIGLYYSYSSIYPGDLSMNSVFLLNVGMYAAPIIGAIVGFNLTRRYKTEQLKGDGLINLDNKKICLSVPGIFAKSIFGDKMLGVRLVNVNF